MSASSPDLRPLLDFLDATDTTRKRLTAAAGAPFRESVRRLAAERDARALIALAELPERETITLHTALVVGDVASPWMLEPAHQLILATQELVPLLGGAGGADIGALIKAARHAYARLATGEEILAHIEHYDDVPGLDGVGVLARLRAFYCAATALPFCLLLLITDDTLTVEAVARYLGTGADAPQGQELADLRWEGPVEQAELSSVAYGRPRARFTLSHGGLGALRAGLIGAEEITRQVRVLVPIPPLVSPYLISLAIFADRIALAPYAMRAHFAAAKANAIALDALGRDRSAALSALAEHRRLAPAAVTEAGRRAESSLNAGDTLGAYRLLCEGILRPFAVALLQLAAIAAGKTQPLLTRQSQLSDFQTTLAASQQHICRLLDDEVEVDIRNAEAHATAQHLAKGTIIIPTHEGTFREINPILVEQRYWGLRCLLYGVDAALELRVISELAQHDPARPDLNQASLAQLEAIAAAVVADLTGLYLDRLEIIKPGHCLVNIAGDCSEDEAEEIRAALKDVLRDAVNEVEVSAAPLH
jgi:hypothetical protein